MADALQEEPKQQISTRFNGNSSGVMFIDDDDDDDDGDEHDQHLQQEQQDQQEQRQHQDHQPQERQQEQEQHQPPEQQQQQQQTDQHTDQQQQLEQQHESQSDGNTAAAAAAAAAAALSSTDLQSPAEDGNSGALLAQFDTVTNSLKVGNSFSSFEEIIQLVLQLCTATDRDYKVAYRNRSRLSLKCASAWYGEKCAFEINAKTANNGVFTLVKVNMLHDCSGGVKRHRAVKRKHLDLDPTGQSIARRANKRSTSSRNMAAGHNQHDHDSNASVANGNSIASTSPTVPGVQQQQQQHQDPQQLTILQLLQKARRASEMASLAASKAHKAATLASEAAQTALASSIEAENVSLAVAVLEMHERQRLANLNPQDIRQELPQQQQVEGHGHSDEVDGDKELLGNDGVDEELVTQHQSRVEHVVERVDDNGDDEAHMHHHHRQQEHQQQEPQTPEHDEQRQEELEDSNHDNRELLADLLDSARK